MTDPTVARNAAGENASTPPAKSRLAAFVQRLRVPQFGIVSRLTLIGVLGMFVAVAVSIWTSVKITGAEMYRPAQADLSINDVLRHLLATNIEPGLIAILASGLIMFALIRRIFAPIGAIKHELVAMAKTTTQQEVDARTLAVLDVDLDELRKTLYARGEPRREGDQFLFGDKPVNNDLALADSIGAENGTLVSIFMADQRVTTNVRNADGERILGTKLAPGPVYDRVLKQGKTFRGDATIFGRQYFSIYEPVLFNGKAIGILYVGRPHLAADENTGRIASQSGNEIDQMRDALSELKKAAAAKEIVEREAAEQRQEARDAQRHLLASQRDTERHMQEERARNAAAQTGVVSALAKALAKLSDGDLTIRLSEGFTEATRQIRDDFNLAVERLQRSIGAIVKATREVSGASSEISASTTDLSQRGAAGGEPRTDLRGNGGNLLHRAA